MKNIYNSLFLALVGVGLSLGAVRSAQAQATLTNAEVYKVNNSVSLSQGGGGWSPAGVGDRLNPQDSLRTGARSKAELFFNEGSLVRTGEGTTFYFPPGRRSFEVINGSTLIMIRPGLGASRINTPEANIVASGTALFVQHDEASNTSLVGVLTESPAGPVTVTDIDGETSVQLSAGQFVSVANGAIGLIEHFILPMFYDSVDMAMGLAPGQESFVSQQSPAVQETINAVRAESIGPFNDQVAWMGDLCQTGFGTLQQTLPQVPLLGQILPVFIPTAVPIVGSTAEAVLARLPQNDLVVTPLRSLGGATWLSEHCASQLAQP